MIYICSIHKQTQDNHYGLYGCRVVEVRTRDGAEKAIEKMHKYEVKGRKIIVREVRMIKVW